MNKETIEKPMIENIQEEATNEGIQEQQTVTIKPVIMGKLNQLQVQWEYLTPAYARVGYLVGEMDSPFANYIKNSLRQNYARIVQIGMELPTGDLEENIIDIVQGFEVAPTTEGQTEFSKHRMNWVQLFLTTICYLEKKPYLEFIPRMQFKPHLEGPLMGYIRPILQLEDEKHKAVLTSYIEKLQNICWYIKHDENKRATDYLYKIEGETLNERLLSLVIGGWSAMVLLVQKDENEMIGQFLELCEEFYGEEVLNLEQKNILGKVVSLLSELTHPSLDLINAGAPLENIKPYISQFVQTTRIFPLLHSNSRHVFYGLEKAMDFDLFNIIGENQKLKDNTALWRFKENGVEYVKILNLTVED